MQLLPKLPKALNEERLKGRGGNLLLFVSGEQMRQGGQAGGQKKSQTLDGNTVAAVATPHCPA